MGLPRSAGRSSALGASHGTRDQRSVQEGRGGPPYGRAARSDAALVAIARVAGLKPGELAVRLMVPGFWVDWMMTCARPLKALRCHWIGGSVP